MRNYLLKTKESSRRNSRFKYIISIVALVAVLSIGVSLFGRVFSGVSALVIMPFYATQNWFAQSTAPLPLYFRGRNELINEINRLKEQIAIESGKEATITLLTDENERLTELLRGANEAERIIASIVAQPPRVPYDVLLINKGGNDGVEEGDPVLYGRDSVIGIVVSVYASGALVELFSSPKMEFTAYIIGPDVYAAAVGLGGGVIRVSVPQGITLSEGNVVVLPQLQGGIVGSVVRVESEPTEPEQYGYVVAKTPLQSLRFVSVGNEPFTRLTYEEAEALRPTWVADFLQISDIPPEVLYGDASTTSEERADVVELE